jgi:aminopeptidase N
VAYVWADLGHSVDIEQIRWLIARSVPGTTMTVDVSTDRKTWLPVATVTDFTPGEWQSVDAGITTRYVRFTFENDDEAPAIGYLADVEILP